MHLGNLYSDDSDGVSQNLSEALKWWRLAAAQGQPGAQTSLGFSYDLGFGVNENDSEAVKWYRLAAEQGYARAQSNLGMMYFEGTGVPQNYLRAYGWLAIAAAEDNGKDSLLTSSYVNVENNREFASTRLTNEELMRAQNIVIRCLESNYQDCEL
jgi:TPR repeat protein